MPTREVPGAEWSELPAKLSMLAELARIAGCTALVLKKQATLSWLLGARSHVPNTLDAACFDAVLETDPIRLMIVSNAIEGPRLRATELRDLPAEFRQLDWWEDRGSALPAGKDVGTDIAAVTGVDLSGEIATARRVLLPGQRELLREIGHDAAAAATRAVQRLARSHTEYAAAGIFAQELLADGMDPIVLLVAGDARMSRDRHPIPTTAPLGPRAMLVCCARRHGLVASVTRIVAFEPLADEQLDAYTRLLAVEAGFLDATRPGAAIGDVVSAGVAGYGGHGFDTDEWHRHHQGGFSGWEPREFPANPRSPQILGEGNVVAWNPSADGWKVEDTALVTDAGPEPVVRDGAWPELEVSGRNRPAVLEL